MITFKELLAEFKATSKTSSGGRPSNVYKLYDWGTKDVYNEAGSFTTAQLAFTKLNQLYKRDPEAYGDLGVIKYEGNDVYSISQKGNSFFKSKI